MRTEPRTHVRAPEPMSLCDRTKGEIACTMSMLKAKFAGVITVASALDSHASGEFGADWIIDVYFLPSRLAEQFEDVADACSVALADALGVQVVLISHTEEATQRYYADKLQACCAFDVKVRSLGTTTLSGTAAVGNWPASWHLTGTIQTQDVAWGPMPEARGHEVRKAA